MVSILLEHGDLFLHLLLLLSIVVAMLINDWYSKSIGVLLLILSSLMLMGLPSPICNRGEVVASYSIYEEAIYLLIGTSSPRVCTVPWTEEAAKQLQDLTNEGLPFYFDPVLEDEGEPLFHPIPQTGTPPKPEQPAVSL